MNERLKQKKSRGKEGRYKNKVETETRKLVTGKCVSQEIHMRRVYEEEKTARKEEDLIEKRIQEAEIKKAESWSNKVKRIETKYEVETKVEDEENESKKEAEETVEKEENIEVTSKELEIENEEQEKISEIEKRIREKMKERKKIKRR